MFNLLSLFAGTSLRTKVLTAIGIVICFALFMALRAHDKSVRDEVHTDYQNASTEAVLGAVGAERKANMESAKRNTLNDDKTATIQESIDYAEDNGTDPVVGYFDGLRKANSGGTDKPAK